MRSALLAGRRPPRHDQAVDRQMYTLVQIAHG
jgi:hypothetical protein